MLTPKLTSRGKSDALFAFSQSTQRFYTVTPRLILKPNICFFVTYKETFYVELEPGQFNGEYFVVVEEANHYGKRFMRGYEFEHLAFAISWMYCAKFNDELFIGYDKLQHLHEKKKPLKFQRYLEFCEKFKNQKRLIYFAERFDLLKPDRKFNKGVANTDIELPTVSFYEPDEENYKLYVNEKVYNKFNEIMKKFFKKTTPKLAFPILPIGPFYTTPVPNQFSDDLSAINRTMDGEVQFLVSAIPKINGTRSDGSTRHVFPCNQSYAALQLLVWGNKKNISIEGVLRARRLDDLHIDGYHYDIRRCDQQVRPYLEKFAEDNNLPLKFFLPDVVFRRGRRSTEIDRLPSGAYFTKDITEIFAASIALAFPTLFKNCVVSGDLICVTDEVDEQTYGEYCNISLTRTYEPNGFKHDGNIWRYTRGNVKLNTPRYQTQRGYNGVKRRYALEYIYKNILMDDSVNISEENVFKDLNQYLFAKTLGTDMMSVRKIEFYKGIFYEKVRTDSNLDPTPSEMRASNFTDHIGHDHIEINYKPVMKMDEALSRFTEFILKI